MNMAGWEGPDGRLKWWRVVGGWWQVRQSKQICRGAGTVVMPRGNQGNRDGSVAGRYCAGAGAGGRRGDQTGGWKDYGCTRPATTGGERLDQRHGT